MSDNGPAWRTPLVARVAILIALIFGGGALLPLDDGFVTLPPDGSGDYEGDLGYRLLGIALAAVAVAWAYRGRIELRDGQLVMRYMLTTRSIPLDTIVSVTPTDAGLAVETNYGARYSSPRSSARSCR